MSTLKIKFIALCISVVLIFTACEKDNFIANNNVMKTTKSERVAGESTVAKTLKKYASSDFKAFRAAKSTRTLAEAHPEMLHTVAEGTIVEIEPETLTEIRKTAPNALRLDVPVKNSNFELELVKADIFTDDFKLATIDGQKADFDLGLHYHGIIKGDNNSLVAVSFQNGEITGFFSNERGNYIIGKIDSKKSDRNEHIVYLESDLTEGYNVECATEDDGIPYPSEVLEYEGTEAQYKTTGFGIRVYLEIDNDIFVNRGSSAFSFVTTIFNQSAALYANEGVNIKMSEMRYWPNPSPYTGSSIGTLLRQFQDYYSDANAFNGHFGHLVSFKTFGSGKAGSIGEYCSSDIDDRMCYTGLRSNHSTPSSLTYTRSVKVFTHEMGHLLGSRHTHACVWNGNGTAIDGCAGRTEGSCGVPSVPTSGGTIMSYCDHSSSGTSIKFSNGFGTQPGNVIRNTAAQMLNGIDTWLYTTQFGWGYFYGDGLVYTSAYGTVYLWEDNGDVCNGEGVWFYIYDGACGYGAGWFYDGIYGTDRIYSKEAEGWITCTNGTHGLIAENNSSTETTGNESHLKSSDDIMANAPDFDRLTPIVEALNPNKANITQ